MKCLVEDERNTTKEFGNREMGRLDEIKSKITARIHRMRDRMITNQPTELLPERALLENEANKSNHGH